MLDAIECDSWELLVIVVIFEPRHRVCILLCGPDVVVTISHNHFCKP